MRSGSDLKMNTPHRPTLGYSFDDQGHTESSAIIIIPGRVRMMQAVSLFSAALIIIDTTDAAKRKGVLKWQQTKRF
jgi:hypothetical protein